MSPADERLHNWDFVGRCYDALKVDPLDIETGDKFPMAFEIKKFDNTRDGRFKKPACTDHIPSTGGGYQQNTKSVSSSYDFHSFIQQDGSLTVSDPTGALYSATLSASFKETRDTTQEGTAVVTYTSMTVRCYQLQLKSKLELKSKPGLLKLDPVLDAAVGSLPASDGADAFASFIDQFGTHYAHRVLFGGRAHQRITIAKSDYSSFLEAGLDVQAEAKATFDVASGQVKGGSSSVQRQKFVNATKNSTESIVFAGAYAQLALGIDTWASAVHDDPAPIQVELHPLSELLTQDFFPHDSLIAAKQQRLSDAIDGYLASKGDDVRKAVLHYGDEVVLCLGAGSPQRYLSAADPRYTRTAIAAHAKHPAQDAALCWVLVNADNPSSTDAISNGDVVALKSSAAGYLDAQAGSDHTYALGDGLTAPTGKGPAATETRWKIVLADTRPRSGLVDGDYVRFQSQWQDPDGDLGYLVGETNRNEAAQRVCAFGDAKPPRASIWRLSRETREEHA